MANSQIHPTAVVDPKAEIDTGVRIGPFAVIEDGVSISAGTKIGPNVHIQGLTKIGPDNEIGSFCTLGHAPQHTGYQGAPTGLVIGRGNSIREYVSVHRALIEGDATVVGDDCMIMAFAHIAHDCKLGDRVTLANASMLAGHVEVSSDAFISGLLGIHQFCRVGRLAMVGGMSRVTRDVPPFMIVEGIPAAIRGLNVVGLRRAGFNAEDRRILQRLYRTLYRSNKGVRMVIAELDVDALSPEGRELIDFYGASKRGVTPCRSPRSPAKTQSEN